MGAKGGPKTGGRKKGSINKATASVQAKLEKIGLDPIASMRSNLEKIWISR